MPYLSGPKKVECVPIRKSTANSSGMLPSTNPTDAPAMIAISASLTQRISQALS